MHLPVRRRRRHRERCRVVVRGIDLKRAPECPLETAPVAHLSLRAHHVVQQVEKRAPERVAFFLDHAVEHVRNGGHLAKQIAAVEGGGFSLRFRRGQIREGHEPKRIDLGRINVEGNALCAGSQTGAKVLGQAPLHVQKSHSQPLPRR